MRLDIVALLKLRKRFDALFQFLVTIGVLRLQGVFITFAEPLQKPGIILLRTQDPDKFFPAVIDEIHVLGIQCLLIAAAEIQLQHIVLSLIPDVGLSLIECQVTDINPIDHSSRKEFVRILFRIDAISPSRTAKKDHTERQNALQKKFFTLFGKFSPHRNAHLPLKFRPGSPLLKSGP